MWLGLFQPLLHDRVLAGSCRPLGIVLWTTSNDQVSPCGAERL